VPSEYHYRGAKRGREARDELGLGQDGPLEDILVTVEAETSALVVVLALPDDVAGAYIMRSGLPLLVVSGTDHVVRQRFTLAHEFGHFWMGHESVVDRSVSMTGYDHNPTEVEANSFAAEFLVPKQAICAWAAARSGSVTLEDVVRLAWEYGVSTQMMRFRLNGCGVLGDQRQCERLDERIAENEHVGLGDELGLTPVEDELAEAGRFLPRIPTSLRESLLGDLLAGEVDAQGVADQLGRDVDQVRRMLANLGLDRLLPSAF
jgi:Zn-dependent peptidase ImmA (M78 family)